MADFTVKALDASTWPDFAALVERNNGVWGGCWCMGFHPEYAEPGRTVARNRAQKESRVRAGRAHAALVYDGDTCVGWCQFGAPAEVTRIKHGKAYAAGMTELPAWRITCFFIDKANRHRGVATAALAGALDLIAQLGGGVVESYPEEIGDRKVSSSFLHNATLEMFEAHGFERTRRLGKDHWVAARVVEPSMVPGGS
jgi:GNAT superfamily N-acetyltransferase